MIIIDKSKFGGMRKKGQKASKQTNNLNKFLNKQEQNKQKNGSPSTSVAEGKKKLSNSTLNQASSKEKLPSPPPVPKKITLSQLAKLFELQQILEKCPQLQLLVNQLSIKSSLPKDLVANLLKKHLQSSGHSLWSTRYAPKQISELFNIPAGKKIRDWLLAFFQYKNKLISEDESFFSPFQSEKQSKVYKNIKDNEWQLIALLIRGRSGIGKSSVIRAVAKEMNIDLQECGNEYNQTKYLREKNESTQSQSVKNVYNKKAKVEKNAQMITKFIHTMEKERPSQNKKMQMIHNVSAIYPESQANKFYNQLSRCVSLSKIPFVLTNSGYKMPKQCERYDVIDFELGNHSKLHSVLWVICHIESLIILDKLKLIEKQHFFKEINNQIEFIKYKEYINLRNIEEVCQLYNYNLDYIFTFLQHHRKNLTTMHLRPFFVEKYQNLNQTQLLEEITFIKKSISHLQDSSQKSEDNNLTQESIQCEKPKQENQNFLKDYRLKLSLLATEDTVSSHQLFKKYTFQNEETEYISSIPTQIHKNLKRKLSKKANQQVEMCLQKTKSTLKPSEVIYLPMLLRQKRASRNSRVSLTAFQKIYEQKQLDYLKCFGHFISQ